MKRVEHKLLVATLLLFVGACFWRPLPPQHPVKTGGCDGGTLQLPDACFVGGVPDPSCGNLAARSHYDAGTRRIP